MQVLAARGRRENLHAHTACLAWRASLPSGEPTGYTNSRLEISVDFVRFLGGSLAPRTPGAAPKGEAGASSTRYLSIGEVCARLGVTESTLRNWTDAGLIAAFVTPGGHRRYSETAV